MSHVPFHVGSVVIMATPPTVTYAEFLGLCVRHTRKTCKHHKCGFKRTLEVDSVPCRLGDYWTTIYKPNAPSNVEHAALRGWVVTNGGILVMQVGLILSLLTDDFETRIYKIMRSSHKRTTLTLNTDRPQTFDATDICNAHELVALIGAEL